MPLIKRLVPLAVAVALTACIDLPEVADPESPANAGTRPDAGSEAPSFTLSVTPTQVAIAQGSSHTFQVSIARKGGFADAASIHLLNPPSEITTQPVTIAAGSTSAELPIFISQDASPGPRSLVLKGTTDTLSSEVPIEVTVLRLEDLRVQWIHPSQSAVHVNGELSLSVFVDGGTAESVELWKEEMLLAHLSAAPYQFNWDTTQEAEGTYQITARAKRGNSTFTSTLRTVIVDRTAPTVVALLPLPGAADVPIGETFQASFSEPLKPSSVTNSSVTMSIGGTPSIAKTLLLTHDGTRLTVIPGAPPMVPSPVTILLGSSEDPLTDLAGNPVNLAETWAFTIPVWLPMGGPISAMADITPAENATLQIGLDGKPVIAWAETNGAFKNIYVSRWNGSAWEALGTPLDAVPGSNTPADHPALVIDGANRPIVIWDEATGSAPEDPINPYARRWNGEAWESLPDFPAPPYPDSERPNPAAALDNAGNLYVLTEHFYGTAPTLLGYKLIPTGSDWQPLNTSHSSHQIAPTHPAITAYGSGKLFIAYDVYLNDSDFTTRGIAVMTEQSSQLGDGLLLNHGSKIAGDKAISVDGSGAPLIAWQEASPSDGITDGIIYAARWDGAWQILGVSVSTNTTSNAQPSLVIASDGSPVVAWSGYSPPERGIQVSRWTGGSWQSVGTPLSGASGVSTAGFKPVLAADASGQLLVAWQEFDGTTSNIYVYRLNN